MKTHRGLRSANASGHPRFEAEQIRFRTWGRQPRDRAQRAEAGKRSARRPHRGRRGAVLPMLPGTTGQLRSGRSGQGLPAPDPRLRGLVAWCASSASSVAFASESFVLDLSSSRTSSFRSRRSDSSTTALPGLPVRAARILTISGRLRRSSTLSPPWPQSHQSITMRLCTGPESRDGLAEHPLHHACAPGA